MPLKVKNVLNVYCCKFVISGSLNRLKIADDDRARKQRLSLLASLYRLYYRVDVNVDLKNQVETFKLLWYSIRNKELYILR